MKVAFLSSLNPFNINSWSGTLYHIFHSLKNSNAIDWIGEDTLSYIWHYHQIHNGYNVPFIPERYAPMFGEILTRQFNKNREYDIIIARDYYFISHIQTNIPIIYIGDTTFNLFKHYLGVTGTYFAHLAEQIEQKAISNADLIIFSSEWAKKDAINHYGASSDKIKVIEFGANLQESQIPKQDTMPETDCCNLLFIGKNWKNKGGDKIYQTYLFLRNKGFNCTLTIIGCKPESSLDNSDPNLHVIPFINKSKEEDQQLLDKILRNAHFFILPTVFDCYGIVFCEASAYGIPSIAADVGGVRQVIRNGKNGYLLPPNATPEEYARQISEIWNNPQKYQELRLSSRQEFEERLNWNVWERKINCVLTELIISKNTTMKTEEETAFYIPTYVINLKERTERKVHISKEFEGKPEFGVNFIEACTHPIGAVGLWNSIVKIIEQAVKEDDDVILICEDDHYFTEHYSKEYFCENIINAHEQGADILSGGIGGFGYAVPVAKNRYWVDWLWCTQFIVVYKKFFQKILDYKFKDDDTADGVISQLSNNLMTLYPFISRQKEFGYSDITQGNKDNPNLITQHFERADAYLSAIHKVSTFYNYNYDIFSEK